MYRLAIALSKGGVGKTTTTVSLAAGLARAGCQTLVIDTDTQGQVAAALGVRPSAGLAEVVNHQMTTDQAITPARDNLYLLAGGHRLAGVGRILAQRDQGAEHMLSDALAGLDSRYDVVLIDTGPGWSTMTLNVLYFAPRVLVPIELEPLSMQGLVDFAGRVESVNRYWPVDLAYVLPTFLDRRRRLSLELLAQLETAYPGRLCAPIRNNVKLSEAPAFGQTIFEYAPRSPGAEDYRALTERILADASQTNAQHVG